MRIVVAPYTFKGTLAPAEAARAITLGVLRWRSEAVIDPLPLADGGTGTLDALIAAGGGTIDTVIAPGPLGESRPVRWGLTPPGEGIVEAAECIPLAAVPPQRRDPSLLRADGLGTAILSALRGGAVSLAIGLGDTATHDCGLGVGSVFGYRFLDQQGKPLVPVGASLHHLASIIPPASSPISAIPVRVLCDVLNPLLGPDGAARRFASQKGASSATVDLLEEWSGRFAEIVARDLGVQVAHLPGAGAAGGLGAGLAAFLGGRLVGGGEAVLDAVGFDARLRGADLVITGEGTLDAKTLLGKGVGRVMERARAAGVPVLIIAGRIDRDIDPHLMRGAILLELGAEGEHRPFDTLAEVVAKGLDGALSGSGGDRS